MWEEIFQHGIKYAELVATLAAIFTYISQPIGKHRAILIILVTILVSDWAGYFYRLQIGHDANLVLWFNIMVPVQLLLWAHFYFELLQARVWRRVFLFLGALYALWVMGDLILYNDGYFKSGNYTIGVILLSILCLRFIFELTSSDDLLDLWNQKWMYVAFALLFFYLGTLPFHNMRNYLFEAYPGIFNIYYFIFLLLNYFLYSVITIVLLWKRGK